ncbi:hypothetical protein J5N97_002381 [Dioscorea zingiberensis]|uniref:C2H2-type domain-containing protein n=1 Tax=Dioscorea zingiberensis TaxID=325984 RepID=A0A9D5D4P0_9LILI|nr:hypothetical protein J5N97_002381 [Dioscorea zingiberensis]
MQSAMEQTRYWMWTRSKLMSSTGRPLLDPSIPMVSNGSSSYESWEEKAFAEDSAAHLGGCVWPPRSYSCSFCRREFRSAQALGGHMNVHRRDRARLKQPPSPPMSENGDDHDHHNLKAQLIPPQVCSSVDNQNTNPNSAATQLPLSFSTVLVSPPSFSSSYVSTTQVDHSIHELTLGRWINYSKRRSNNNPSDVEDHDQGIVRKRRRIDYHDDEEGGGEDDELDLELRLGDRPKSTTKDINIKTTALE